jgi:Domain of unknown function (DUF6089)
MFFNNYTLLFLFNPQKSLFRTIYQKIILNGLFLLKIILFLPISIRIFALSKTNLNLIMLKRIFLFTAILLGFYNTTVNAQFNYNYLYHEIGIYAGPVFLKSDFGARDDFENFYKNNGFNIGVIYYLSGDENYNSLRDNFKLRLEASYMESNMKHYGKYVDGESNIGKEQLRAMSAKTSAISTGLQLEFYPLKTDDYYRGDKTSPYVSLGSQISLYSSDVNSSLGKLGNSTTTLKKYIGATRSDVNKIVTSVSASIGTRYKLSEYHSLLAEVKLQYYFSDWVDGLNPDRKAYPENKTNDYLGSFNIGYIYYLDQN